MRDYDEQAEAAFFALFADFFDSEKDAAKQHTPENYSLDRMFPLARLAEISEPLPVPVIHVAGTKGKGSTCFFLEALLRSCGKCTGIFTSPHLDTVRERFQINGRLLGYQELTECALPLLTGIRQQRLKPSLFEIFTVLALRLFLNRGVDYIILETGIGGRLDATNFLSSVATTVITPVSFDHTALLGKTIEAIASEKAGILKPGVPLVLGHQPFPAGEQVIRQRATALGCPVIVPADTRTLTEKFPCLSALPAFLQDNFALAWTAATAVLHLAPDASRFALPQLRARFEVIRQEPLILLDAAHNADSMQKLVSAVRTKFPDQRFTVILGIVQGKDVQGIVSALTALPADFILTNPHTGKGSALPELEPAARQAGLNVVQVIPDLRSADQLPTNTPLLFTGSFFTALIAEEIFPLQA